MGGLQQKRIIHLENNDKHHNRKRLGSTQHKKNTLNRIAKMVNSLYEPSGPSGRSLARFL